MTGHDRRDLGEIWGFVMKFRIPYLHLVLANYSRTLLKGHDALFSREVVCSSVFLAKDGGRCEGAKSFGASTLE